MKKLAVPDIIIAIDGYSSTGKSTFAKLVAKEFSFLYLDSGALYRAVTLFSQEEGIIDKDGNIDEEALKEALKTLDVHFEFAPEGSRTFIGGRCVEKEIRGLSVSSQVSPISALAFVRSYVDDRLHEFGKSKRVVMDGRDIGTTVFPDAEIKIFLTAEPEIRAKRRFDEMVAKGDNPVFEDIVRNLEQRDRIDSSRAASPLSRAADAYVLDNSDMSLADEIIWITGLIQGKFSILE